MVKAAATDIDGTLTVSRNGYKLSLEAIRTLKKHGIPIILVSGNALSVVIGLSRYLGTSGPVLGENGCLIFYRGRKYHVTRESAVEVAKAISEKFREFIEDSWQNHYRELDFAFKIRSKYENKPYYVVSKIEEFLKAKGFSHVKILFSGFTIYVAPKSCGKAKGLTFASKLLKIPLNEILGVGDGLNDIELLEAVGFPTTVSNADPELKRIAKYVTSKPSGAGFSEIVEQIISGRLS